MTVLPEILFANAVYAENFGEKASLPLPPARRFAILTSGQTPSGARASIRKLAPSWRASSTELGFGIG